MAKELHALTGLLKGKTIKRVVNNSCFRADQYVIELEDGVNIQFTYEHPIIDLKVIKVTENDVIDERIYGKIIEK